MGGGGPGFIGRRVVGRSVTPARVRVVVEGVPTDCGRVDGPRLARVVVDVQG